MFYLSEDPLELKLQTDVLYHTGAGKPRLSHCSQQRLQTQQSRFTRKGTLGCEGSCSFLVTRGASRWAPEPQRKSSHPDLGSIRTDDSTLGDARPWFHKTQRHPSCPYTDKQGEAFWLNSATCKTELNEWYLKQF